jgi:hypothetical protein
LITPSNEAEANKPFSSLAKVTRMSLWPPFELSNVLIIAPWLIFQSLIDLSAEPLAKRISLF